MGDDVGLSDEDLRRAAERRTKPIDIDTILAVQDSLEADNKPDFNGAGEAEPRISSVSGDFVLRFSQSDLDNFVASKSRACRKIVGLD